ncbi:biliverdin-producing heme oxygenase [Glacieibacterium megasporae]|uniref:biliverdin-producing heme oxygenase n=1 Tax=Glacieibacterium megasporae TaxID=2835787 RepID=UPI001C1DE3A3|nr:biliverdin-producing heme oxygenase [Polymorphobacter megasporae]UAJ09257.1 biliverdin-producing heme oxygenase [Polymorphobacter megasporae]
MTSPDRRSRLRSATDHAHRRLDAIVNYAGFFDDCRSYAAYLDATLEAREPLERALTESGATTFFEMWPDRLIAPALRADIADVRGADPRSAPDAAGPLMSAAQTIGSLYVLEGSALGGRQLALRAYALGMGPAFGARHFARQTAIPKSWSAFLRVLEALPLDAGAENECIAAALAAFASFERAYAAVAMPPLRALRSPPPTSPRPPPALSRPSPAS